jgi:hypothetical protein
MRKSLISAATAAILGFGAASLMIGNASAAIVCDNGGNCWHVKDKYDYPPTAGVVVHEDNWKWDDHDHDRYRWREHDGRGYWRDGGWVTF